MSAGSTTSGHGRGLLQRPVLALALLLGTCIALVVLGRQTGLGVIRMPEAAIVQYRDIRFGERADGSFDVADAATGAIIGLIGSGSNGYVKGVMRGRLTALGTRAALATERPTASAGTSTAS